ncbi:uncharacterized protein LOC143028266 [Oratosquilla oratoria]|uniref:uncharacterized protein LOC143028266 n=1 Tax=Oratosquilla oratoria TaxID=337810 RepID=UPI003F75F86E
MEHILDFLLLGMDVTAGSDESSEEVSEESSPDLSEIYSIEEQTLFLAVGTFIQHHEGLFMEKELYELIKKLLTMEVALDDIYTQMLDTIKSIQTLVLQKSDLDMPDSILNDMMASSSIAAEQNEQQLKITNLKIAMYFKGKLIEELERILHESPYEVFIYEHLSDSEDQDVLIEECQTESQGLSQAQSQDEHLVQSQGQSQNQTQSNSHHSNLRPNTFNTRTSRPLRTPLEMRTQVPASFLLQPTGAMYLQTPETSSLSSGYLSQFETPEEQHPESPPLLLLETVPLRSPHLMQMEVHREGEIMLHPSQDFPSQEIYQTLLEPTHMEPQEPYKTQQTQQQQPNQPHSQETSETQSNESDGTKTQEPQESRHKKPRLFQPYHPRNLLMQLPIPNTKRFLRLFLKRLNDSKSELHDCIHDDMKELPITMRLTLEKFIVDLESDFLPKIMSSLDYNEQLKMKLRRMMSYLKLTEKVKNSLETEQFPYLIVDRDSPSTCSPYLTSDENEDSSEDEYSEESSDIFNFETRPQGLYRQLFERMNLVVQYLIAGELCSIYESYIKILEKSVILMNDYVSVSRQCVEEGINTENIIPSTLLSAAGIHGNINMALARKLQQLFDVTKELEDTKVLQRRMQEKEVYTGEESPVEGAYFRLKDVYHQDSSSSDERKQRRSDSVGSQWFRLQDTEQQEEPLDESQQPQEQELESQESFESPLPTQNTSVSVHINVIQGLSEFLDPKVKMVNNAVELSKKMLEVKLSKLPLKLKSRLAEEMALIQAKFLLTLEHLFLLMKKEVNNQQTLRSFLENMNPNE